MGVKSTILTAVKRPLLSFASSVTRHLTTFLPLAFDTRLQIFGQTIFLHRLEVKFAHATLRTDPIRVPLILFVTNCYFRSIKASANEHVEWATAKLGIAAEPFPQPCRNCYY